MQDELAHAIAAILAVHVSKAEAERVLLQPPSSWRAYEFYLRAAEAFRARGRTRTAVDEAGRLVREALSVDPQFARAHALLSKVEWWNYVEPCNQHYLQAETLGRARELATKAVQLAPHLPEAHAQLGWTLLFERRHDDGVAEFERAFALNCNFVDNRLALALVYAGRPQDAIDVLGARIELDPFQPFDSFGFLGHAQSMLGQDEKAVRTLAVYPSRAPAVRILPLWLAAAYARIGDLEHAHAEARQVLQLEPEFTIHRWGRTAVYRREEDAERLFGGLRMAGLA
ncbi:MAG: tetratricopeptide repeat protein [Ramlibacter sp.]